MAEALPERDARPDPEALLALPGQGGRGRLTVFIGAAPGVGKTYAMLARATRLKAEGVDIVVGLVETHGRAETAAFLTALDVLPRRALDHQGRVVEEFDLDAALRRRPRILVVDELAHSNAPGCRHPKRWQDVEELLAAGIDVWTAVNVQHLESLADVVAGITGVQVRERVPDTVLARADEVVLIDLSPAELLDRLREGKVYVPDNARRAAANFFRLGNLTALRELALRRTADRVDDQMVDYLRQNAIEGPWQTAERLLVCIGPDPLSEKVVRAAARLASGLNAPWLVVSVERPDRTAGAAEAARVNAAFELASSLGAETRRVAASDFVEAIMKLARREHASQIVIGARRRRFPATFLKRSLTDALIARVAGLAIHVVTDADEQPRLHRLRRPGLGAHWVEGAAIGAIAPLAASAIGYALDRLIELPNVSLLYLLAVFVAAVYGGYAAALSAAFLSALAYNFLFINPAGTFRIAAPHEVVGFVTFVVAALLAGGLASRIAEQAGAARRRAASTQALYDFSRTLSATVKSDDVAWAAVAQLRSVLGRAVTLLLPKDGELAQAAAWPPDAEMDVTDLAAARWAYGKKEPAGRGTGTLPGSRFQFRPLVGPGAVVGVIGVELAERELTSDETILLGTVIDQTAIAIDRARLSDETLEQAAKLEGDRFRSALLSSISHDLRTPLAAITGAVTSLRQFGDRMKPESRDDLLASIEEESERLARFVANLLDMTRIEAGTVDPKRDWVDVADVIRSTLARIAAYFPGRKIETSIAPDLPLIRGDSVLLGQVLFNLVDNSLKYGGGEPVSLYARSSGGEVTVSVTDLGRGIPARDLENIFAKFFRRGRADSRKPGTGLGLAIAKGFVEAMGGRIKAESPAQKRRGTRITIALPIGPGEMKT